MEFEVEEKKATIELELPGFLTDPWLFVLLGGMVLISWLVAGAWS